MTKKRITACSNLPSTTWAGQNTCIVGISVGQMYHEGRRLRAIFDFVSERFEKIIILVADSLRRYTLAMKKNQPAEFFLVDAIRLGDEWLDRNQRAIQAIPITCQITRFSHWVEIPDYAEAIANIRRIYGNNSFFKEAVHTDVSNYLARYQARAPKIKPSYERWFPLCMEFLLEEVAVCSLLSQSVETTVECYPGTMPLGYEVFSKHHIKGAPPGLENWTYITVEFQES